MHVSEPGSEGRGWAFGIPVVDLTSWGYREDEYFFEGEATRYGPVPGTELGWDGRWQVEVVETVPYKSRLVVIRPYEAFRFNGTVFVGWNNVSAGYENFGGGDSTELLASGSAYVAVSAQRVGVHGTPENPQGLRVWDPARYETLSIPGDDYSFDIFTQAARLVAPDRASDGIDPMGGLDVRRLIAQGASQSAARLATYLNAVQPSTRIFDAFWLLMYFGGGTPLEVGDALMTVAGAASDVAQPRIPEGLHLLRDDLGIPVMVLNTECEASSCYGVRQDDTDLFRYWEIAGASHVSLPAIRSSAPRSERDFGFSIPLDDSMESVNQVSIAPVVDAALGHMVRWVDHRIPPPVEPRIEFEGDPPQVARDANGIARGGIRLPDVEVPTAHNSAIQRTPGVFARLVGSHESFSREQLGQLYTSHDDYVARYEAAARAAVQAGVVLARDVDDMVASARVNATW